MPLLRFAAVAALALWTGGLTALGAVAGTSIFTTLERHDPAGGRDTAALVFGDLFQQFQYFAWGLATVILFSLGLRRVLGPRPPRFAWRLWTVAAMLGVSLVTTYVVAPRIETMREEIGAPVASLPEGDPRRAAFGRLHALSTGLMFLTIVSGLGVLWMEVKDPH